jgi:YVTN family beta-propeller protein
VATETTTVQVIPSSVDVPGMSVVTASRNQDAPRSGLIYNPATLAAAVPVWFHPMDDGRYLTLFSRRLTDAALSSDTIGGVLLYTGYQVNDGPCWAIIGPRTGEPEPVKLIPSELPGTRHLVGAASRGRYLFTLSRYKKSPDDDETYALLQNFRVAGRGITLLGEEMVPRDLALGIYCDRRYLSIFGNDGDGNLAIARKNWGRIGTNSDANPVMNWQFWGQGKWNGDPEQLSAIIDDKGKKIAVAGTCSMARYRDTFYLMVSETSNTTPTGPSDTERLSIALNPNGSQLYVADYSANKISIIDIPDDEEDDTATNTVTATIDNLVGPWSLMFNPDGTRLYVSTRKNNTISVIDPTTNKLTEEITVSRSPGAMVFHPNGTRMYVINTAVNMLTVVDLGSKRVIDTITVGKNPSGAAISANGSRLYVTNTEDKTVSVIDTVTNKVIKTASVGYTNKPDVTAIKGTKVYVGGTDSILSLDTTRNRVTDSFPALNIGLGLLAHPTLNRLYLANLLDTVTVIDTATNTVTKTIPTGTDMGAVQIALNNSGTRLYATNSRDRTVSVIDTATNAVIKTIAIPAASPQPTTTMNSPVSQLTSLLNGVINGFIPNTIGAVTIIANLLDQAVSQVTGQPGLVNSGVTSQVTQLLGSLTGTGTTLTNPASILEQLVRTITGIPGVSTATALAEDFLSGVFDTILGIPAAIGNTAPALLLERVIRTITGIPVGTGTGGGSSPAITIGTTQVSLTPEPSWQGVVYVSRAAEQGWKPHGFSLPIAKTTTVYQDGGGYLQEQIPVTPGYGVTTTSSGISFLNITSDHVQVYTGTNPHTVILPPTAKVVGTTISTEGAIEVPDTPQVFVPTISVADATIKEGNFRNSTVRFRVTLSSSSSSTIAVNYITANGTATAGTDYTAATGKITFVPGIVSQEIAVEVSGDWNYETNESFSVFLSQPANATIDDGTAVCTIVNDDRNTLIESLMEDLKNILNGISSGAIQVGRAVVTSVTTILEQSTRTLTGVVGDTGNLVLSLVDTFLDSLTGGDVDLGEFDSPAELLASIMNRITGGTGSVLAAVNSFADTFIAAVFGTNDLVGAFQDLIGSIFTPFSGFSLETEPMSISATSLTESTEPVVYMTYTIHNQSTADIVVMASDRDKTITVPHGTGLNFTPYVSEPTLSKDWSRTPALERAPRARQGFPYLSTSRLNINTYRIDITGSPASGSFRLAHNGHVSQLVTVGSSSAATADSIRLAIASLSSVTTFTVTAVSATRFTVVLVEDCSALDIYSYRLLGGTSPKVQVSLDNSDSTLLTRWGVFQPDPKPAAPSGAVAEVATSVAEIPAELPDIVSRFAKVITVVSTGVVSLGSGVIATVTDILGEAVYLITGQQIANADGKVTTQVTDFLTQLAVGDGVTADAATSFENVLRQITGGTGITAISTVPAPLDFVTNAVNAAENTIETLSEWLQKILNAITGN